MVGEEKDASSCDEMRRAWYEDVKIQFNSCYLSHGISLQYHHAGVIVELMVIAVAKTVTCHEEATYHLSGSSPASSSP